MLRRVASTLCRNLSKTSLAPRFMPLARVPRMLGAPVVRYTFATGKEETVGFVLKTQEDWEKYVMKSDKPVVLDFYADWCGPCQRLAPMLVDKAKASNGAWNLVKCNIDEFADLAQALNIQSVPTVILVHQGEAVDNFVGLPPQEKFEAFIEKAASLGKKPQA